LAALLNGETHHIGSMWLTPGVGTYFLRLAIRDRYAP
jgi:hypothetical protein